jgi:hypothetical protein
MTVEEHYARLLQLPPPWELVKVEESLPNAYIKTTEPFNHMPKTTRPDATYPTYIRILHLGLRRYPLT